MQGLMLMQGLSRASQQGAQGQLGGFSSACVRQFSMGGSYIEGSYPSQNLALANNGVRKAGPGGRSSVSGIVATIFGANGFVGSYVTNELANKGSQVITPYRSTENAVQHLKQMGDLGQVIMLKDFQIFNEDMVRYAISRSNVVINLIGQRTETVNYTFDDVHVNWPKMLGRIVAESPHVERLIHFSELGAEEGHASRRLASKAKGDRLLSEQVPSATIVRPGPVVGIEDHFYNYMIYQLAFGVVAPVIDGGVAKIQPTWVRDVADSIHIMLKRPETVGKTFYLGGPEVLSIREVYDTLIKTLRLKSDDTIHLPKALATALLKPMDKVRRLTPPLPTDTYFNSVDYVEEATRDRVMPAGALGYKDLDFKSNKVTDGLPMEPVRHFRVGGYSWGDMASVAKDVPENIRKYYNIK
ncbi:NADH:ubiquinone oxidoreductase 39 kDa subunit [Dunaliella salina]|uniref:NADH:ubiquinone oxidoreductase 39 kDa subunit n=1 Tax=Dunaliella salina TaxID=3046 RepID=A0ABQ7H807_DUNSA|nr:NADH:ubiquinone oxidoreductase 39 kDa subunit [Dunaliella salina]|eukprot:KAF5842982.1 NADH:ubiquinone oxidoreductase 39 kDa subunit [Dunaliella salina]